MRGCRIRIGIHITHCGVRTKWVMCAASGCNAEKTCTPVEPVPMTATRLPRVSMSVQRAVCTTGPANESRPGMSGMNGWCRTPVAAMTKSASISSPSAVRHPPSVVGEHRLGDFAVKSQMRFQLQLVDEVAVVALDLVAGRPHVVPVGLGRERELVAVGRHVAAQTGVAVPVPDAADVGTLFQDGEVVEAGLAAARERWRSRPCRRRR